MSAHTHKQTHTHTHRERARERENDDRLCDWNFYARRRDLSLFNLLTYLTHTQMHAHTHTHTRTGMFFIGTQIKHIQLQQRKESDKRERRRVCWGGWCLKFGVIRRKIRRESRVLLMDRCGCQPPLVLNYII